jgi:hypothetical protein
MSIQIIDGFQVNTASPIDNRIVASGSVARNAIPYKYEGLRVFDTSDSVPYVYVNGAWQSENASGISGAGNISYLPVYTSSNVLGNSLLYQTGYPTFLIKTINTGSGADKVIINASTGLVTAVNFSGGGANITGIAGSNINNGSIVVDGSNSKLINGSTGQVLLSGISYTSWSNQNQLSVGTASNAVSAITSNNVVVSNNSTNVTNYITFVSATGSTGIKSNAGLSYNPSDGTLRHAAGDLMISSSVTNTNGYVIRGTRLYQQSGIGYTSGSATIAQVVVPSSSAITVEVTFTGGIKQISGLSVVGSQLRSAKYVAAYTTNGSGVITQSGSTNTILNVSSLGTGSALIYSGSIDTSTSYTIKFNQSWTGPSTGNGVVNATVDYKITVCSI